MSSQSSGTWLFLIDLICRLCLGDGAREIFTLLRGAASVPVELRLLDFESDAVPRDGMVRMHQSAIRGMFESELQSYYITFSCETSKYLQTLTSFILTSVAWKSQEIQRGSIFAHQHTMHCRGHGILCLTWFNNVQTVPIIQPKRFSDEIAWIAWFLGWFWASGLPCWRSEPEVTPEAQRQLCRNFSLTMSPDCLLRYWWATGARGLRLCRRLFVEADTLHKIWFQVQSQNLELLEFDVAQKKEFIEYIWGHRRNRYTKHQSRICLDLMLFSAILSVRSPPPLCEWSKFCVTSIIVDHLCILSFAFVSSCRLSARQLGVTHVHLDQAALRRSSREKVRTASKHRNLPELQMTVATVATVHPKLFSAPGLQWLRLEVGQWALESYATVELFLSLSFMMPMQFDAICTTIFVHSHSHLLLSSELSTFSILALHPARC